MRKGLFIFGTIFFLLTFSSPLQVKAGGINGYEASVIAAASATFEYDGGYYVATSSTISDLRLILSDPGVDLTADQANRAISSINSGIAQGVSNGYLVWVGSVPGASDETDENETPQSGQDNNTDKTESVEDDKDVEETKVDNGNKEKDSKEKDSKDKNSKDKNSKDKNSKDKNSKDKNSKDNTSKDNKNKLNDSKINGNGNSVEGPGLPEEMKTALINYILTASETDQNDDIKGVSHNTDGTSGAENGKDVSAAQEGPNKEKKNLSQAESIEKEIGFSTIIFIIIVGVIGVSGCIVWNHKRKQKRV